MRRFFDLALLIGITFAQPVLRADPTFTRALVQAEASGSANGLPWDAFQQFEFPNLSAGQSGMIEVTPSTAGGVASGNSVSSTSMTLELDGVHGSILHSSTAVPANGGATNFAEASNKSLARIDFTIDEYHRVTIDVQALFSGPTSSGMNDTDVFIYLHPKNNPRFSDDYSVSGITNYKSTLELLAPDTYEFTIEVKNDFDFKNAVAGTYERSGELQFSFTLTPIPECSTFAALVAAAFSLQIPAFRRRHRFTR